MRRRIPRGLEPALPVLALIVAACGAMPSSVGIPKEPSGRDYSYAVYGGSGRLLHSPIEDLQRALAIEPDGRAVTDVYVIAHGWNYTTEESLLLYENYRHLLIEAGAGLHEFDPEFRPFIVFVSWSSVSRPLSSGLQSLLPFETPWPIAPIVETADAIAFHVPSVFGETQDALRLAVGPETRLVFPPPPGPRLAWGRSDEYEAAREQALPDGTDGTFEGIDAPLSVVIDEILDLKLERGVANPGFRVHVVGHSFGGKMAALATHDACARRMLRMYESDRLEISPSQPLVDSLVLIQPAMRAGEMYQPIRMSLETRNAVVPAERLIESMQLDDGHLRSWDGLMATEAFVPFVSNGCGPPAIDPVDEGVIDAFSALRLIDEGEEIRRSSVAPTGAIGAKILVANRRDSANGWLFVLGQLILNHDALSVHRTSESSPKPLKLFDSAVDLGESVIWTVSLNVVVIVSEPIGQLVRCLTPGDDQVLRPDLVFSAPFDALASIGHEGFDSIPHAPARQVLLLNGEFWLSPFEVAYLEQSEAHDDFESLSAKAGNHPALRDLYRFQLYDASDVFDGLRNGSSAVGAALNPLYPPAAHGDLRSPSRIAGVRKRDRTLDFVFNTTRWRTRTTPLSPPAPRVAPRP